MTTFRTMMAPKWTGSTPSCLTRGRRTGVRMIRMAVVSMKVPRKSRKRFIMRRMSQGSLVMAVKKAVTFWGIWSAAMSQPKTAALAMMNMMMAVMTALSARSRGRWPQRSSPYTKRPTTTA